MQTPGPAQLELIRRYARTLRELQSQAVRAHGPRAAVRERRLRQEAERFARSDQAAAEAGGSAASSAPAA